MEEYSLGPGPKGEYYLQENGQEFSHSLRKKKNYFAKWTQRQINFLTSYKIYVTNLQHL